MDWQYNGKCSINKIVINQKSLILFYIFKISVSKMKINFKEIIIFFIQKEYYMGFGINKNKSVKN